jgi:hypothetical protein
VVWANAEVNVWCDVMKDGIIGPFFFLEPR